MKVIAECDSCGKLYKLPEKYCGKHIRCKACGEAFTVPMLEESLEESGFEEDFDPGPESEVSEEEVKKKPRKKKGPRDSAVRRGSKKSKDKGSKKAKDDDKEDDSKSKKKSKGPRDSAVRKKRDAKASGVRASGVRRKGTRSFKKKDDKDEPESGEKSRKKDSKKPSPKDSAVRKRRKTGQTAAAKEEKDSKGRKNRRTTTGTIGRKKKATGTFRKASKNRGRRGGDEDGDEGASKKNKTMLAAAGGGALLLVIIVVVMMMGPSGPSPEAKRWYKEVTQTLDAGLAAQKSGNINVALEQYGGALQAIKRDSAKYPTDTPHFPKFKDKVATAEEAVPKLEELFKLLERVRKGEGHQDVLARVNDTDPGVRMAVIKIMDQDHDYPDFQKALSMLTRDKDPQVAQSAKIKLMAIGGKFAIPFLAEMLQGAQADRALDMIVQLEMEEAVDVHHKALEILDPKKNPDDVKYARRIVTILGNIGAKKSAAALEAFKSKCQGDLLEEVDGAIETCKEGE